MSRKKSGSLRRHVLEKNTLLNAAGREMRVKRSCAQREARARQKLKEYDDLVKFLENELRMCEKDAEEDERDAQEAQAFWYECCIRRNKIKGSKHGGRKRRKTKRRKKRRRKRTHKGGKRRSSRTKKRRPYVIVKIERNPLSSKKIQKGGFLGALAGGLAKTAMGSLAGGGGNPLGGLAKSAMGALGGGGGGGLMNTAMNLGKDVLGRAQGGLMDKIGGFVNGVPGMGGGGGGGGGGGDLLGGAPSVDLLPCDPSERPEFPKGPDGCGKHESPKPTVKQLKQGFVDDDQNYQLENY